MALSSEQESSPCPHNCGIDLKLFERKYHIENECPKRWVKCQHDGCDQEKIRADSHQSHQQTCNHRIIPCGSLSSPCYKPLHAWLKVDDDDLSVSCLVPCQRHNNHPIVWAATKSNEINVAELLLDRSRNKAISFETPFGDTPLIRVAANNNLGFATMLLDRACVDETIDHDAFVNNESCRGKTALREAAMNNNCDAIKLLISRHADINYVTKMHGKTAMDWAKKDAREELQLHCRLQAKIQYLFMRINCGDLQSVKKIINRGRQYKFNRVSLLEEEIKALERGIECTTHRLEETGKTLEIAKTSLAPEEERLEAAEHELTQKRTTAETNSGKLSEATLSMQQTFRYNVVDLKEKLSVNIHEFINLKNPPARILRTSKAICLILGIMPDENTVEPVNGATISRKETFRLCWKKVKSFAADGDRLYQRLRYFDFKTTEKSLLQKVNETLNHPCADLDLEDDDDDEILPKTASDIHKSLNAWVLAICKCVNIHYHISHLIQQDQEYERKIEEQLARLKLQQRNVESISFQCQQLEIQLHEAQTKCNNAANSLKDRKEELETARLLETVTRTGHTLLSWAAATGATPIVEELINKGAITFGYGEEYFQLSARLIQNQYRYYMAQKAHKHLRTTGHKFAHNLSIHAFAKKMIALKSRIRVPLIEAVFNGHAHVFDGFERQGCSLLSVCRDSFISPLPMIPYRCRDSAVPLCEASRMNIEESVMRGAERFSAATGVDGESHTFKETFAMTKELRERVSSAKQKADEKKQVIRAKREHEKSQKEWSIKMVEYINTANFKGIVECARNGISIDSQTTEGITPLMRASMEDAQATNYSFCIDKPRRKVAAVPFLLDRDDYPPTVNFKTEAGTALTVAALHNRLNAIVHLSDRGANIDQRVRNGKTALIIATEHNHVGAVELLLDKNANIHAEDNGGRNSIDWARQKRHNKILAILTKFARGNIGRAKHIGDAGSLFKFPCCWGCGLMETNQKLKKHEKNECSFRHVKCAFCEIDDLQEQDRILHESTECHLRPISCRFCQSPIPAKDISSHEEIRCPERRVQCALCQQEMRAAKLPQHEQFLCDKRPVRCPNHCGAVVSFDELSKHKHKLCTLRRVECRTCGSCMQYKERAAHEEHCTRSVDEIQEDETSQSKHNQPAKSQLAEKENVNSVTGRTINNNTFCCECNSEEPSPSSPTTVYVPCKNMKLGCKWNGPEANLLQHMQSLCHYAFIHPCPLGCSLRLRKVDVKRHKTHECRRRIVRCVQCGESIMAAIKQVHDRYECQSLSLPAKYE